MKVITFLVITLVIFSIPIKGICLNQKEDISPLKERWSKVQHIEELKEKGLRSKYKLKIDNTTFRLSIWEQNNRPILSLDIKDDSTSFWALISENVVYCWSVDGKADYDRKTDCYLWGKFIETLSLKGLPSEVMLQLHDLKWKF